MKTRKAEWGLRKTARERVQRRVCVRARDRIEVSVGRG